jgi:hypothetical protein
MAIFNSYVNQYQSVAQSNSNRFMKHRLDRLDGNKQVHPILPTLGTPVHPYSMWGFYYVPFKAWYRGVSSRNEGTISSHSYIPSTVR